MVCANCARKNEPDARFCAGCGAALAGDERAGEVRKVVTVVFTDLVGSTSLGERLDPEALRRVMSHYFAAMEATLERHGGTVEKFIGDAIMAVFGIPTLHEDDALRAVRAAAEMREQLARLNEQLEREHGVRIAARTGVNTGQVIAGDASARQALATGDAVNVAARLEQAAATDEILLGEKTHRLVRDSVRVEALTPLALKGKQKPLPAWRVVEVLPDVPAFTRPLAAPFVGRADELKALEQAFRTALRDRSCTLATIAGPPGIGKSRLARELVGALGADTRVLVGRCLPYGEGITYWPLAEIVRQLAGTEDPTRGLAELIAGDEQAVTVAALIAGAIGASEGAGSAEGTAWAFRRLLEALAHERPLLVVVDDIHWAEPTLLDLLEYVVSFSSGAPMLLLCLARPDLFDSRPSWAAPRPNTTLVSLAPLSDDDTDGLIERLLRQRELSEPARARIVAVAEGNPLFVEQILAMHAEAPDEEVVVSPTIQALLAARIDRLVPAERAVLERASVEGRLFHRGAVAELLPVHARAGIGTQLLSLIRKEFLRPDRSLFPGDDGFRFNHILIRDAAYDSLPKQLRAELHEVYADWLEQRVESQAVEYDEILGYHLEQAYRYRAELGPVEEQARTLASRAGKRLGAAGQRALARWDLSAAVGLLERAAELLEEEDAERLPLLVDLGEALAWALQLPRAEGVLEEALQQAQTTGDERLEASALLSLRRVRSRMHPWGPPLLDEARVQRAIRTFEEHGDERGLANSWLAAAALRIEGLRERDGVAALGRALEHAERASDMQSQAQIRLLLALTVDDTSANLSEVRTVQEDNLAWAEATGSQRVRAASLALAARLAAREGRFEEAGSLIEEARALFGALGVEVAVTAVAGWTGEIAELADDLETAERAYREGLERAARAGDRWTLAEFAHLLGRVLDARGAQGEAEQLLVVPSDEAGQTAYDHIFWRSVRARELARRGRIEEAVTLAREAVVRAAPSDNLRLKCEGLEDLVHVLLAAGRPGEAIPAVEELVRLRERKGEPVAAAKARSLLAQLRPTAMV